MEKLLTCEATGRLRAQVAAVLLCALLSACATTQRSSTSGAGRTSESAPPPLATSASEAAPPASTVVAATPAPKAAASVDEGGPMQFPTDSNGAQVNDQAETATEATQATTQARQQLANEDAAISKLREQQEADTSGMQSNEGEASAPAAPTESAGQPGQQSAQQQPEQQQPEQQQAPRTPSPVAALHNEEQAVQFPENKQDVAETARPATRNDSSAAAEVSAAVSEPADRSVYFNYDEATVLAKYDAMLMADAAYLGAHLDQSVEVQGNCDERGSREYNLALGARRAESVKRALELGGVASSRIHAISFGAEKPVAMGHDEGSWSQNRRADIVDK